MDKNTGESSEVAEGKTSRKKLLLFSPSLARSPQYTYELGGSKVSEISSSSDVKFLLLFLSTISTRPLVIYRLNCSSKSEKKKKRTRSSCDTTGNGGSGKPNIHLSQCSHSCHTHQEPFTDKLASSSNELISLFRAFITLKPLSKT